MAWRLGAGVALGVAVAAVEVVPLGAYLAKSPVWADREQQKPSAWSLTRPRLLDAACTALPYAFGSQRRGHPNLARAVGVHNLNESAGGFAGLATLVWLAPLGWSSRRGWPRAGFLAGLVAFGALGAFGVPAGREPAAGVAGAGRHRQPPADPLGRVRPGPARRGRARSPARGEGPTGRSVARGRRGGRPARDGGRRRSGRRPSSARGRRRITPRPPPRRPGADRGRLPRAGRAAGPRRAGVRAALPGDGRRPGARAGRAGRGVATRARPPRSWSDRRCWGWRWPTWSASAPG